jgi:hypothetical protein
MYLLPSKIASPLSINSLTANIQCSFATVLFGYIPLDKTFKKEYD